MKNKGSVLFITTALMLVISIISVSAFSMFYRTYSRNVRDYEVLIDKITIQTIAQDIYIELSELELNENNIVITLDGIDYLVTFKDGLYEFNLEASLESGFVYMNVKIDSNHQIHTWKVWN